MTQDEAKTKWCPFANARVIRWDKSQTDVNIAVWVGPKTNELSNQCIASNCMAWRWKAIIIDIETQEQTKDSQGYCGLAGK